MSDSSLYRFDVGRNHRHSQSIGMNSFYYVQLNLCPNTHRDISDKEFVGSTLLVQSEMEFAIVSAANASPTSLAADRV